MKILIIDKFLQRRDPAQTDMYSAIASEHQVGFSVNPLEDVIMGNYDLLYLGIYHQTLDLDLCQILFYNTAPVIIDQADNEEFVERDRLLSYAKNIKYVLSRYLPNEVLGVYCDKYGIELKLLPWYVNPNRFTPTKSKSYDLVFIGSLYGVRNDVAKNIESFGYVSGKSVLVGESYGGEYSWILSRSYMAYMECGRLCMTQKYIEASLSGCVLVGDKPLYPANELVVYPTVPDNYANLPSNRDYVLRTFANEQVFLERFNELLK